VGRVQSIAKNCPWRGCTGYSAAAAGISELMRPWRADALIAVVVYCLGLKVIDGPVSVGSVSG
jgi:hypothetical protein